MRTGLHRLYRREQSRLLRFIALLVVSNLSSGFLAAGAQPAGSASTEADQTGSGPAGASAPNVSVADPTPGATNPDAPIELPETNNSEAPKAVSRITFQPPASSSDGQEPGTRSSASGAISGNSFDPGSGAGKGTGSSSFPSVDSGSNSGPGRGANSFNSSGRGTEANRGADAEATPSTDLGAGQETDSSSGPETDAGTRAGAGGRAGSLRMDPPLPDAQAGKERGGKQALAQNQPGQPDQPIFAGARKVHLPGVVGTVETRKPFKLVVKEQLIHNISFRDTPVKEVIAELARRGNLNIIIDKSSVGTVTGEMHDVTLNEAMDSVLAAAGLHTRTFDNNTVLVASPAALVQLGLGRPMARAFKLSYSNPWDIATILQASVFNKGAVPYVRPNKSMTGVQDTTLIKDPMNKMVRAQVQVRTQEGVGFNNAATDPGSQQIRAYMDATQDYQVDQNGGGPIVIPDSKNRQVIVVGSVDDIKVAEEAIHLLDRRPKEVHIQASLVELNNQGIRELGANLNVQGGGASGSVLGNAAAPLISYLPGLGSLLNPTGNPPSLPFSNPVTNNTISTAFSGLIGSVVPFTAPAAGGLNPAVQSQSAFNFLTLGSNAGGRSNIATAPTALNVSLNLLLQTNKAKVIANPSVVVSDNTETLITIADEVIHKVTSTVSLGVVTTNVELTKAGVFLNVLPKVTEDGFIIMRLRPQVSAPLGAPETFGTTTVTLLSVRDVMTQEVRIKDGQTLVIGGLFQEQESAQLSKVPYLSEAPVLGALFRNTLKGRQRTELMLLITPKIVEDDPASPNSGLSDLPPARTM